MIDLTDIFTLWCFHNVKNNSPNNVYGNTRVSKVFFGYICFNKQEKIGIEIGKTLRYLNLIFQKFELFIRSNSGVNVKENIKYMYIPN